MTKKTIPNILEEELMKKNGLFNFINKPIHIDKNNSNNEANKNYGTITPSQNEALNIPVKLIHNIINRLIDGIQDKINDMQTDTKVFFYMWNDPQSLQLSFSISSKETMPFQTEINSVQKGYSIVNDFIADCKNGFPNFNELYEDENSDFNIGDKHDEVLNVFVKKIEKASKNYASDKRRSKQ